MLRVAVLSYHLPQQNGHAELGQVQIAACTFPRTSFEGNEFGWKAALLGGDKIYCARGFIPRGIFHQEISLLPLSHINPLLRRPDLALGKKCPFQLRNAYECEK